MTLFEGQKLPTYADEVDDVDTKALAGSGGGMRRISIKGGVFREMIGGKEHRASEERFLNVAVVRVAQHNSRQFFPGTYVEGEKTAPVCWSSDGLKPDGDAKDKQGANCASCPQNIKGSGQGDSRACRYQRRLAVMVENDINSREVYQLIAPATSLFGDGERGKMPLQKYAQHLHAHGTPITKVVTEVRFDTASTQPKLIFKAVRVLTNDEYAAVVEMRDSAEAIAAVTLNVAQTDGHGDSHGKHLPSLFDNTQEETAPVSKPAKPAKVVKEAIEPEAEIEEPKKAASKKSTVEPKIADLVNEWDD